MAGKHKAAVKAYEDWTIKDDEESFQDMINKIGYYLDAAAAIKCKVLSYPFAGAGVGWAVCVFRNEIYWILVFLILAVMIASASTEDFPANITKPRVVIVLDIIWEFVEVSLIMAHACIPSAKIRFDVGGLLCFGAKVTRAHLIGNNVSPESPVQSSRDHFNAIGPSVVAAGRSLFSMMERPVTRIPHAGPGEPFKTLLHRGVGLSNLEREELLAVVYLSPILFKRPRR